MWLWRWCRWSPISWPCLAEETPITGAGERLAPQIKVVIAKSCNPAICHRATDKTRKDSAEGGEDKPYRIFIFSPEHGGDISAQTSRSQEEDPGWRPRNSSSFSTWNKGSLIHDATLCVSARKKIFFIGLNLQVFPQSNCLIINHS